MSKFYITTPIYYINDQPHIGHAYASLAADVAARFHRQHGDEVKFLTGTDENSQKTVNAATAAGESNVQAYANQMAERWQEIWRSLSISHDRFIRTTEKDHHSAVEAFIKLVKKTGDIYEGTYEGWYCVGCESFKREDELVEGKCPDHDKKPEWLKEDNYFFRLSKYQPALLEHIQANPGFIWPESRRNEVVAFIERGLEDISISRPAKKWGIPFPGDHKQVVYVWFDALINYLSGVDFPKPEYEKWWPADVHVVGKDIIKFHCTIWPAMLMSAGLKLPEKVVAHGFYTIDGIKISKSLGNAIDPTEIASQYGVDALRYYLLREIPFGTDGDFSHDRFSQVYNSDLANELGNLVQRTAVMITKYLDGVTGEVEAHSHDASNYNQAVGQFRFDKALEAVWEMVKGLNQYVEEEKPWELAKTDTEHLKEVLIHLVADLLQIATLLLPFLPETSQKIIATFASSKVNPEVGILFPKVEIDVTPVK